MMTFWAFSSLINFVTSTSLGCLVYWKNRKHPINITYALFCLCGSVWSLSYFLWQISDNASDALFWCRSLMAGAIFVPIFYLHHLLFLLKLTHPKKPLIIFSYCFGIIFFLLNFTPFFIESVSSKMWFDFWPDAGPLFLAFCIVWFWLCLYGIWIVAKQSLLATGVFKVQLRYVLIATTIGWSGGFTNYPLWFDIEIPPIGNIFVSVYISLTAYAIIKYHLMDIRIAVTRLGVFLVVYSLVLGIPFGLTIWGQEWLSNLFGKDWFWLPMTSLLVLATVGPFIFLYIQRRAEERINLEEQKRQDTLSNASYGLNTIHNLPQLLKLIVNMVKKILGLESCSAFLFDQESSGYILSVSNPKNDSEKKIKEDNLFIEELKERKFPLVYEDIKMQLDAKESNPSLSEVASEMKRLSAEVAVPIMLNKDLLGFLILGERASRQVYGKTWLNELSRFSNQAASRIKSLFVMEENLKLIEEKGAVDRMIQLDMISSSLAHELQNPVHGILQDIEFINEVITDWQLNIPEAKKSELKVSIPIEECKDVNAAGQNIAILVQRISDIIGTISDFSKPGPTALESTPIGGIVKNFEVLMMPDFKHEQIFFTKEVEDDIPNIYVNRVLMVGVLINFAKNAIHATQENKEKKIALRIRSRSHNTVRFEFKDNGCGIKKESLDGIFAALTTSKGSSEGWGLGLFRARKDIVERFKGKIWVESEGTGRGSTFIIEIPVYSQEKGELNG